MGGENLGGSPLWYDTFNIILTRFQATALLAALALVPACAERLNSFAFVGAAVVAIVSGGDVGGGGGNSDIEEMKAN